MRFRLPSWQVALEGIAGRPTQLLSNPKVTTEPKTGKYRELGDRVVTREAVLEVFRLLDMSDAEAVLAAFVLVMAWGSGTSNTRSLRNTRAALQNLGSAAKTLAQSAIALRTAQGVDDSAVTTAHREFSLPGVRESFFTKWFAFAGFVPGRDGTCQPE